MYRIRHVAYSKKIATGRKFPQYCSPSQLILLTFCLVMSINQAKAIGSWWTQQECGHIYILQSLYMQNHHMNSDTPSLHSYGWRPANQCVFFQCYLTGNFGNVSLKYRMPSIEERRNFGKKKGVLKYNGVSNNNEPNIYIMKPSLKNAL